MILMAAQLAVVAYMCVVLVLTLFMRPTIPRRFHELVFVALMLSLVLNVLLAGLYIARTLHARTYEEAVRELNDPVRNGAKWTALAALFNLLQSAVVLVGIVVEDEGKEEDHWGTLTLKIAFMLTSVFFLQRAISVLRPQAQNENTLTGAKI